MAKKFTTEHFIAKAHKKHNNKYDYKNSVYLTNETKVNIICPLHGTFNQTPHDHLQGKGCTDCGRNSTIKSHLYTHDIFLKKAKEIHGDRYKYLSDYVNQHNKISIKCSIHGIFEQKPKYHLQGHGCPNCRESKGENTISNFLIENKILHIRQKKFDNCKNKFKLPFDFYLPELNICIEYDGRQHFEPIKGWGGIETFNALVKNDKIKNDYCIKENIYLLRIKYNDDIKNKLKRILWKV